MVRVDSGQILGETICGIAMVFINISGCMCSFELALFVAQDNISVHVRIAAGSSRKSI